MTKLTDEQLQWRKLTPDDLSLDLPVNEWTEMYQYINDGPGGGLRINIYTNDKHDLVYVRGSFD